MSEQSQQTIPIDLYPPGFAEWLQPLWDARQSFLGSWTPEEKRLCLAVIRGFTELGRGPSLGEVVAMSDLEEAQAESILRRFNKRDALKYDPESRRVVAFYPFSDVPSPHEVSFPSGRRLFGMWAAGAIAIPIVYGTGTEATVHSQCSQCKTPLEFSFTVTEEGGESRSPVAAALREWDPIPTAEDRAQPHMLDGMWLRVHFFCSEEHYKLWHDDRPAEEGYLLDFVQSARICRTFYGDLIASCGADPHVLRP